MTKKLSVAFLWHMHQPTYRSGTQIEHLMPWIRLHGVKDYLDMLLHLKNFPKLKLNFNIVPLLLNEIENYENKDFHDIYSELTIKPIEELTVEDKEFILNNFFDSNYLTMIKQYPRYDELYKKRFNSKFITIEDFSEQEYSDIMMWFNLAWIDPVHKKSIPAIKKFIKQDSNFSLEDRIKIIDIHRDILKKIIPTYKKYQDLNRIEISTSPYYHPILPLLLNVDIDDEYSSLIFDNEKAVIKEDAKLQIKKSLDFFEEKFGKRPQGIWPSEQCVCPETLKLLTELGVKWTISDEGILSSSINKEFIRDFKGHLQDPFNLTKTYTYQNGTKIIFRDALLANLINFEYANLDSVMVAQDLYERIKVIQSKIQSSPDEEHLITIALDGENCWENYPNDGNVFLSTLYELISNDETLETVLISEYLDKVERHHELNTIHAGSWLNRNFQLWIGEPTKDLAWSYVIKTHENISKFIKTKEYPLEKIEEAKEELLIAEGSDWFWWYGEPNNSGKDEIFDYLFRSHLQNVYKHLGEAIPEYLFVPLTACIGKPSRYPERFITPKIGDQDNDEWMAAGCIDINAAAIKDNNKFINQVCFGNDENNVYFQLKINQYALKNPFENFNQIHIYFQPKTPKKYGSRIRLMLKTENTYEILKEKYSHALQILFFQNKLRQISLAKAIPNGLWQLDMANNINYSFGEYLEISLPFKDLDIDFGESIEFFFIYGHFGIVEKFFPQDLLINITRTKNSF